MSDLQRWSWNYWQSLVKQPVLPAIADAIPPVAAPAAPISHSDERWQTLSSLAASAEKFPNFSNWLREQSLHEQPPQEHYESILQFLCVCILAQSRPRALAAEFAKWGTASEAEDVARRIGESAYDIWVNAGSGLLDVQFPAECAAFLNTSVLQTSAYQAEALPNCQYDQEKFSKPTGAENQSGTVVPTSFLFWDVNGKISRKASCRYK